ncbi:MAG: hypothetical protein IKY85_04155 [Bacteroidaceae bacterium]|nr:hypothetical protein [Bacteroidaceae bacterium]
MNTMSKFYILMLVLLLIAIINLARALKEKNTNAKVWGITINVIAVVLLGTAVILGLLQ